MAAPPTRFWDSKRLWVVALSLMVLAAMFTTLVAFLPKDHAPLKVALLDGGVDASQKETKDLPLEKVRVAALEDGFTAHGTQMAALLNSSMAAGNPPSMSLIDIKVLDEHGRGDVEDLAWGIEQAITLDADMIVCSLAVEIDSPRLTAAVSRAVEQGIVVVAAAGNGIGSFQTYPAGYPGVLSIGALDENGDRRRFTNARAVAILAPGENIPVTVGGEKQHLDGTSPATAIAAQQIITAWHDIDFSDLATLDANTRIEDAIRQVTQ